VACAGRLALVAALAAAAATLHPAMAAHAAIGAPVSDAEMPRLDGQGKARVFGDAEVTVVVFLRAGQDRSLVAMRKLAKCQKELAGRSLRWVGVVAQSPPPAELAAKARESGFEAPMLVDTDDALYGSLGIATHPVVVIAGRDRKLAAFEVFNSVDFCTAVSAQARHALREISDDELRVALAPPRDTPVGVGQGAKRYRGLAEALFKSGNSDKALEYARRSIELDPAAAPTHALLGEILAAQGQCPKAIPAFEQALSLDPANASAKSGLDRCRVSR
jgi:tetratricopeptide (TPR) repeat protein